MLEAKVAYKQTEFTVIHTGKPVKKIYLWIDKNTCL